MSALSEAENTSLSIGSIVARPAASPPRLRAAGSFQTVAYRLLPRLVADLLAVSAGLATFWAWSGDPPRMQILFALGYVVVTASVDASHVRVERGYVEEFVLAAKTAVIALLLTAVVGFLIDRPLSRVLLLSVALTMVVTRPIAAVLVDRFAEPLTRPRHLLAVCSDAEYERLEGVASKHALPSYVIRVPAASLSPAQTGLSGPWRDLGGFAELCARWTPARVIVGNDYLTDGPLLAALAQVNEHGVVVSSFARSFEAEFGMVPVTSVDSSWFLFDLGPLHRLGYRVARRLLDLASSLLFAAVLALVLPVVVVAIRLESPGPIFFSQERVGQGGRVFRIHKLRTMQTDAEVTGPQFTQHGDTRVTRVGAWLRRCRIDELPQAINLLRGEMSLIGPRPERPEFVATFAEAIPFYEKRSLIKPGITGWAQVHEGYSDNLEDTIRKLERDLYYLRNQSLRVDLRIVLATIASVVSLAGR